MRVPARSGRGGIMTGVTRRMGNRIVEFRPPRIAFAFLAGATLIHAVWPGDGLHVFSSPLAAAIPGVAGFVIMMQAWWQFRVRDNAICPTEETTVLITDGIYRFTRNPMYLGVLLMLLAVALFVGTLPFFAVVVAWYLVIELCFVAFEERKLSHAFGDEFDAYAKRVRRWL